MKYTLKGGLLLSLCMALVLQVTAQSATDNGIKMYNYKRLKSAISILEPLAAQDPQANYYLGLSYLESGNVAKANETFSRFPEDPANISGTARVAFASKDAAKGMQIVKGLAGKTKKKEWVPERYAADAITYTNGGDNQQAIAWYKDVLTKNDNADTHIGLGDAYRKISGGGGEAMNNYEAVTEKDQKNSLAFSRIGDLWYEATNYPSALDNYARAKDADSTNPLPYKALGLAYVRSGKYQAALQNMKKYMQLSDNILADKMFYIQVLYLAKSYCDAADYARNLLGKEAVSPDQKTELTGILGYSLAECGDSVQALQTLHSYFQMQKDPSKIKPGDYLALGKLYLKLGELDSAGVYYNKGIAGDTAQNKTDVYRTIAEAFKVKKDYCKSAEWYDNLVKANPATQALDYTWRGIMFYYCKDLGKAMNAFNEFAAKYPDVSYAIYWQGRTAAAIDSEASTGGAVDYFKKWLDKVGPNYEKKNDLKGAYEYLLYYYFNTKNKEEENKYKELIRTIDPNDRPLHDLEENEKAQSAPAKKSAPAKGKK